MQPIEILPSVSDGPLSSGSGRSDPLNDRSSAEQFDTFIGRALSQSSNSASDDHESPDKPAPRRARVEQNRKSNTTDVAQPDACACAGNSVAQPSLQKTAAPDQPNSKSGNAPGVEGVSDIGKTASKQSDSSTAAVAGSGSLAAQLRSLLPAGPAPAQSVTGLPADSTDRAPAMDEPISEADVPGSLTPDAGNKVTFETPVADPAGKTVGNGSMTAIQMVSPAGSGGDGISSAKQQLPMQKAEKTNEFSAPTEQNLPVSLARDAGEKLPTRTTSAATSPSQSEKSELSTTTGSAASSVTAATESASRPAESLQWPSPAPARSLERTHDLMSLHAFRLRDSGADSLQVVIKPGTGLQLSLDLQMRGRDVEMRATLHRGDFDFLSRHWSQLQQQLESRGIRLAPLTRGDEIAGGNNQQFQNPDRSAAGKEATAAGALEEIALANSLKPAAAPKPRIFRGWETWA